MITHNTKYLYYDSTTSHMIEHMQDKHHIDKNGSIAFKQPIVSFNSTIRSSGSLITPLDPDNFHIFRTCLLGLQQIKGQHSGENLAEVISQIFNSFQINKNLGFFILDNASINDTCIAKLSEEFLSSYFQIPFSQRHLRCFRHILNLVAKALLFGRDSNAFEADILTTKALNNEIAE